MTEDTGVILLAGGTGSRLQSTIPKQFLLLNGKPIIQYSLDIFATLPQIKEIVIVCAPEHRHHFSTSDCKATITFALPGERRQDSVYHGLQALKTTPSLVCVHDAARPLITQDLVKRIAAAAQEHGAAVAAMPLKFTVKECNSTNQVARTPDRSLLWEIQTPQIMRTPLLRHGFEYAINNNITVTDDVSLLELIKIPVQLVQGSYRNIKITTPEDLLVAGAFTQSETCFLASSSENNVMARF